MEENPVTAETSPGLRWGPFTLRIPLVHTRVEWPELVQGLLVAGATGLAIVPIFMDDLGMTFEMAVAFCVVQSVILCASPILFGEPFCPGWLTPALPLVVAAMHGFATVPERTAFVTALVILVGVIFLFFGITGLGPLFIRLIPRSLKAGIIFGAGLSALLGELQQPGDRTPRLEQFPIAITVAVAITLVLLFSMPLEKWKARFRWLVVLAGLGLAPGFVAAMLVGPWVGEVDYSEFLALFVDGNGNWVFGWENFFFWPDFQGLVTEYSPLSPGLRGEGIPSHVGMIARDAVPLALAAYVIGFGDIVTGTEIIRAAGAERPDEKVPFDNRRTHLSVGVRNVVQGLLCGPFFALQGPLWTGAMVVVAERYRRGRAAMQSLFSGIFSYYVFGLPIFFFCRPFIDLYRPVLPVALSLTLILTGFACAYVALALPQNRVERGVTVLTGVVIVAHSTTLGLIVGTVLALVLLGKEGWHSEEEDRVGAGATGATGRSPGDS